MRIRWRGLELPSQVACDKEVLTATYGKFIAEPFERGFGTTIGNSLRRILLSSLEGSAVTQVKLHGAQHEFTSIEGVVEDVIDIVLNVKALVVKNTGDIARVLRVEKNQIGEVTGEDVQDGGVVSVINKGHVLATLSADIPFAMELVVENGRGYSPASERDSGTPEIGTIPVDAAFSPVVRVRYEVEETRVGQKTNYDKLTMEIWTDGSISPEMALVEAAKILRKHLNPFVQYQELGPMVHAEVRATSESGLEPAIEGKLNMTLAEMNLSVRAKNCLESENISCIRDLVCRSEDELLDVRNFGETTLNEVREKLDEFGLRLGVKVQPPTEL